jgi:Ca-activated chloride channel family protein
LINHEASACIIWNYYRRGNTGCCGNNLCAIRRHNVGLMRFSTNMQTLVPLGNLESERSEITSQMDALSASGNTSLYDAVIAAMKQLSTSSDVSLIQAIVLLSEGQDTSSKSSVNDVVRAISTTRNGRTPVLVIPVAYGSDADINSLSAIARASDTKVLSGDPKNIKNLLESIGSYFNSGCLLTWDTYAWITIRPLSQVV